MTERLYYADPYCREFDATIQRVERRGDRTLIVLDRTAFYPPRAASRSTSVRSR